MKSTKVFDDIITIHASFSRIDERGEIGARYLIGNVVTKLGIVSVYSQGGDPDRRHTRLDFAYNGKLWIRNIRRRFTQRGLVTLANRWAHFVANNPKNV